MYAVQLSDGSYSVFELLDSVDISELDEIRGPLQDTGSCVLYNLTTNERFDAIVQNIHLDKTSAKRRSFL